MKTVTRPIAIIFIVFVFFLHGCGHPEPSEIDVKKYLQTNLPAWLTINSIKTKSFINGNSGVGRTSVALTLMTTEPIFRQASQQEVEIALSQVNLTSSDLVKFAPPKLNQPPFFVTSHKQGEIFSTNTELECQAQVQGWSFAGSLDVSGIQGQPRPTVPPSALVLGTQEFEHYLSGISEKKVAGAKLKAQYVNWLNIYIAKGQKHEGKYCLECKNVLPFTILLTGEPALKFVDDEINFNVLGQIHWDANIPPYVGNTSAKQDQNIMLTGKVNIPENENEKLTAWLYLFWYDESQSKYTGTGQFAKLEGSVFVKYGGVSFMLDEPNFLSQELPKKEISYDKAKKDSIDLGTTSSNKDNENENIKLNNHATNVNNNDKKNTGDYGGSNNKLNNSATSNVSSSKQSEKNKKNYITSQQQSRKQDVTNNNSHELVLDSNDQVMLNNAYEKNRSGQSVSWANQNRNIQFSVTPQPAFKNPNDSSMWCRKADITSVKGSQTIKVIRTSCRDNNGQWITNNSIP